MDAATALHEVDAIWEEEHRRLWDLLRQRAQLSAQQALDAESRGSFSRQVEAQERRVSALAFALDLIRKV